MGFVGRKRVIRSFRHSLQGVMDHSINSITK
jgi:hypothetical protein